MAVAPFGDDGELNCRGRGVRKREACGAGERAIERRHNLMNVAAPMPLTLTRTQSRAIVQRASRHGCKGEVAGLRCIDEVTAAAEVTQPVLPERGALARERLLADMIVPELAHDGKGIAGRIAWRAHPASVWSARHPVDKRDGRAVDAGEPGV